MQHLNKKALDLLSILNDGCLHSGQILGSKLNISRAAVWKLIRNLQTKNIDIISIKSRGYQIKQPISFLEKERISENVIPINIIDNYQINIENSVTSTNDLLKNNYHNKNIILLSEEQTSGRGRLGKVWVSEFGKNIYLSLKTSIDLDVSSICGASIAIGTSIVRDLKRKLLLPFSMKWPNDIYCNDKKLGGILIEILAEANTNTTLVIGIGLNVNSSPQSFNATSIKEIIGTNYDRNILAGIVISSIIDGLDRFQNNGFSQFINEFNEIDFLSGKKINISKRDYIYSGIARGIDEQGHLLLDTGNEILHFNSGEASIGSHLL